MRGRSCGFIALYLQDMSVTVGQQMLLYLSQYSLPESLYPGRIYYCDVKQIIQEVGINEHLHVLQVAKVYFSSCNSQSEWRHINTWRCAKRLPQRDLGLLVKGVGMACLLCPSHKGAILAIMLHTYNFIVMMLREIVVMISTDIAMLALLASNINSDGRWICRQLLCGQPSPFS